MTPKTSETILTEMVIEAEKYRIMNDYTFAGVVEEQDFGAYAFRVTVATDGTIPVIKFEDNLGGEIETEDFAEAIKLYSSAWLFAVQVAS